MSQAISIEQADSFNDIFEIAISKIEYTNYKNETIYHIFGRDKDLNRVWIRVYGFLPYFFIPDNVPVVKNPNIVKIKKTKYKSLDGIKVKKIYMKDWNSIGVYDDNGYCKQYTKTYETDIDENNRLAIDLNLKSGLRCYDEDVNYGEDTIEPIDLKIDLRRIHLDIEVSTKLTKRIPTWENPIEPVYSIANFDTYNNKFYFFVQHPDYKNKKVKHIKFIQHITSSLQKKIEETELEYDKFLKCNQEIMKTSINLAELPKSQTEKYEDFIIYIFEKEKFEKKLKEYRSRLHSLEMVLKNQYPVKIITYNNEFDMLNSYINFIEKFDPDIITGWNSQGFDLPYLIARMQVLKCDYKKLSPINQVYIKKSQGLAVIKGRTIFDTWKGFKKVQTRELESLKLDNVGMELFGIGKVQHDGIDNMYDNDRELLRLYNLQDVMLEYTIALNQSIFQFFYDVKCYAGCSIEDVLDNSHIVDTYLLFISKQLGIVLPSKVKRDYEKFEGAKVVQPEKEGLAEYIVVLDLKSLYPYCMLTLNMGEDTIVMNPDKSMIPNLIKSPIKNVYFRKDKTSFLAGALRELLEYRDSLKTNMKALYKSGNLSEAELQDRIQVVVKFITNSIYGVIGWNRFRLYNRHIASCITSTARSVIEYSIKVSEALGYKVHYGDTDSIFVSIKGKNIPEIKRKMMELANILNKEYDIFMKIYNLDKHYFKMKAEKLFKHLFMVKKKDKDEVAKKRYVGWKIWDDDMKLEDSCNNLYVSGFDRSDMSRVGNKIMKKVLMLSACNLKSSIVTYLKSEIDKVVKKEYSLEDISYSKGISKPLHEYNRNEDWILGAKWTNDHSYLWNAQTNYGAMSKPKYIYLVKELIPKPYKIIPNNHKYQVVALDEDNSLPKELIKIKIRINKKGKMISKIKDVIDYKTLIEKTIKNKVDTSLKAVGLAWNDIISTHKTKSLVMV